MCHDLNPAMAKFVAQTIVILLFLVVKAIEGKIEVPRFITSPKSCHETSVSILILVHSAADHFELRRSIRETWTQTHPDLRRVFVIGQRLDEELQRKVRNEIEEEKDILFIETIDSYRNLTFKHLAAYEWAVNECPNAGLTNSAFPLTWH